MLNAILKSALGVNYALRIAFGATAGDAAARPAAARKLLPYGGQAVIEGVMMKGTKHAAMALRRRDGHIETLERPVVSKFGMLSRLPFARGFFILWDMMTLGMWAISESSQRAQQDEDAAQAAKRGEAAPAPVQQTKSMALLHYALMIFSLVIAVFLFKLVPAMATTGLFSLFGWGSLADASRTFWQQFAANIVEGLIKLGIFIGYIWAISGLAEVRRVFEYHGAEHIVINAYEDDEDNQSLDFVRRHGVAHPRCGTSFIVILILASIVLFTLLDWGLLELGVPAVNNLPVWWIRWPLRIVGLVPLAGISYEVIKAAFRYYSNPVLRPLLRFGMLFQALTTRRPADDQIEVSLAAFNRARLLTEGIPEPQAAALQ